MTADRDAAFRALRERAYGPDPDLTPAEYDQLAQWEAARVGAAGQAARVSEVADDVVEDEPEASLPVPTPRKGMRGRLLWGAALVLVAVVAVTITRLLIPVDSVDSGAELVAELAELPPDSQEPLPPFLQAGDESQLYEEFAGLAVVRTTASVIFGGSANQRCIIVYSSSDPRLRGPIVFGCAAGRFPAIAQLTVESSSPQALRDLYPDGTGVKFLLDDIAGAVIVYRSAPSGTPATSESNPQS